MRAVLAAGLACLLLAAPAAAQLPLPPPGGGGGGGQEPAPPPPPPAVAPGPPGPDWVNFRGDPAQRGATGDASITPPFGVAWTADFPSAVGALVIAEGRVFVGRYDPEGERPVIEALDAASGARQWSFPLTARANGAQLGYGGGRVFAHDAADTLVALEAATGLELWREQVDGSQSGPVVAGDTVYVQGRAVTALDAATGAQRWEFGLSSHDGDPAIAGDRLFAAGSGGLVALDRRDGRLIWQHGEQGGSGGGGTITAAADRVFPHRGVDPRIPLFAATGEAAPGPLIHTAIGNIGLHSVQLDSDDHFLVAHDLSSGAELWRAPNVGTVLGLAGSVLTNEVAPGPDHHATRGLGVRDARTGALLWRGRLRGDDRFIHGGFRDYTAAGQGLVVVPQSTRIVALAPASRTRPEPVEATLTDEYQVQTRTRYAAVLKGYTGSILGAASVRIEATPFPFRAPMSTVAEVETTEEGFYLHELRLRRNSRVRVVTNDGRISRTLTKYVDPDLKVIRYREFIPTPRRAVKLRFLAPARDVRIRGRLVGAYWNRGDSRLWRRLDTARLRGRRGRGTAWLRYRQPPILPHMGTIAFCLRGAHRDGLGRPLPESRRCGARRYVQ